MSDIWLSLFRLGAWLTAVAAFTTAVVILL